MNSTMLITGSTGYIGRLLVQEVITKKRVDTLVLPVRDRVKAEQNLREIISTTDCNIIFVEGLLENLTVDDFIMHIDYIIHCASITQSVDMVRHPVEVADSIVLSTKNILEIAKEKVIKSMVYISSMEVYGRVADTGQRIGEDELGMIDLTRSRSCYPEAKRMAELYCNLYKDEYNIPVKIARLAQTFGRGIRKDDNRVYMQFARAVVNGNDIVLKTDGKSVGNYCDADDVIAAIFILLQHGENGVSYNVVNESNTMQIREMAQLVAQNIANGAIKVKCEIENINESGYAPHTGLRLSSARLEQLGWKPSKNLLDMYRLVIKEIKS